MTVPHSVAEVVSDHVIFEVESIDRMYMAMWPEAVTVRALVPDLQAAGHAGGWPGSSWRRLSVTTVRGARRRCQR